MLCYQGKGNRVHECAIHSLVRNNTACELKLYVSNNNNRWGNCQCAWLSKFSGLASYSRIGDMLGLNHLLMNQQFQCRQ